MTLEARAVAKSLGFSSAPTPTRPVQATIYGRSVELFVVGIRAIAFPQVFNSDAIILAGLGGGLDPSLQIGDVVVDGPESFGYRSGAILSVDRIIETPAAKAILYHQTGALVADMESGPVRAFAARRNRPLCIVRAISDTSAEPLDPILLQFIDPFGQVHPGRLVKSVLARPSLLPMLLQMNRNTKTALAALTAALQIVVAQWPGEPAPIPNLNSSQP